MAAEWIRSKPTYTDGKGKLRIDYVRYKFNTLYFEFPRVRADGTVISAKEAAMISATAKDLAEEQIEMILSPMLVSTCAVVWCCAVA